MYCHNSSLPIRQQPNGASCIHILHLHHIFGSSGSGMIILIEMSFYCTLGTYQFPGTSYREDPECRRGRSLSRRSQRGRRRRPRRSKPYEFASSWARFSDYFLPRLSHSLLRSCIVCLEILIRLMAIIDKRTNAMFCSAGLILCVENDKRYVFTTKSNIIIHSRSDNLSSFQ